MKSIGRSIGSMLVVVAALALMTATPVTGWAATIHVENYGLDTANCGTTAEPCRSISQALFQAGLAPGLGAKKHRILVGPGRYGDLNGDGVLSGPGEEFSGGPPGDPACSCMIRVTVPVTIESTRGALVTIIQGVGRDKASNHAAGAVVSVETSDVAFGTDGRGFTVIGGRAGINVDFGVVGVSLRGNLSVSNNDGIELQGRGHDVRRNVLMSNIVDAVFTDEADDVEIQQNVAVATQLGGFYIRTGPPSTKVTLTRNLASGGGIGFSYDQGFNPQGLAGLRARENSAIANFLGIAIDNFDPGTIRMTRHVVIGNLGVGIEWGISDEPTFAVIRDGNIYGNDPWVGNCGVKSSFLDSPIAAADLGGNFWGAPTGPGPEPADLVCSFAEAVNTAPIATSPNSIPIMNLW